MLELFGSGLFTLWLEMAGVQVKPVNLFETLAWQNNPGLVVAPDPNPAGASTVEEYFQQLATSKLIAPETLQSQGIWMQSGPILMANHQGTIPLPAASLTKIATSLASLHKLGADYEFPTTFSATGSIENGILKGNLVVNASGDPLFVWQDAITIANKLNKMGIRQVQGDLVIVGNFAINFQTNPAIAGDALKQVF